MRDKFFRNKGPFSIKQIAEMLDCKFVGDGDKLICGIGTVKGAKKEEVTFLANHKYNDQLERSKAGACILHPSNKDLAPSHITVLISDKPYTAYAALLDLFYEDIMAQPACADGKDISSEAHIHKSANIHPGCRVESGVVIGPNAIADRGCRIRGNAYIGHDVEMGKNVYIGPNVSLMHCKIGDNSVIHAGARIGQDGFGFSTETGEIKKIAQIGGVEIGSNVEIGANTTIDRGAIGDTVIGDNTKIDNLVQIGHNVQIGKNCMIVSQVGVSGSTIVEDGVMIGGQAGLVGHINVGKGAMIAAGSGVIADVEKKSTVAGYPAVKINQWHRQNVTLSKMVKKKYNDEEEDIVR